jgi:hypothetical protein
MSRKNRAGDPNFFIKFFLYCFVLYVILKVMARGSCFEPPHRSIPEERNLAGVGNNVLNLEDQDAFWSGEGRINGNAFYTLKPRPDARLEGFFMERRKRWRGLR